MAPDQLPGRIHDLLLQLEQLPGQALLTFAGLPAHVFLLAENVFEVPHLGEKHVALRPPRFSLGTDILGPEVIGDQIPRFGAGVFNGEKGIQGMGFAARQGRIRQIDFAGFVAKGEGGADSSHPEVVPNGGFHRQLLQGGNLDIAFRENEVQLRRQVRLHPDGEPGRLFVGAIFFIDQVKPVTLRFFRRR